VAVCQYPPIFTYEAIEAVEAVEAMEAKEAKEAIPLMQTSIWNKLSST
jgi:hypothetical protein